MFPIINFLLNCQSMKVFCFFVLATENFHLLDYFVGGLQFGNSRPFAHLSGVSGGKGEFEKNS